VNLESGECNDTKDSESSASVCVGNPDQSQKVIVRKVVDESDCSRGKLGTERKWRVREQVPNGVGARSRTKLTKRSLSPEKKSPAKVRTVKKVYLLKLSIYVLASIERLAYISAICMTSIFMTCLSVHLSVLCVCLSVSNNN